MGWTRAIEFFFLPPSGLIFLGLAGLLLFRTKWRRPGLWIAALCGLSLYLLSTPLGLQACLSTLDRHPPRALEAVSGTEALVVLGAGTRHDRSGVPRLNGMGLERLESAAKLYHRIERPILVAGYSGELMAATLEGWAIPVRWIEGASRNTHQNATHSERMLRQDGFSKVILVTHFWHMPRAVEAFRHAGLEVAPAPMGFAHGDPARGLARLLPSSGTWTAGSAAVHEWAGRPWYRLRYGY